MIMRNSMMLLGKIYLFIYCESNKLQRNANYMAYHQLFNSFSQYQAKCIPSAIIENNCFSPIRFLRIFTDLKNLVSTRIQRLPNDYNKKCFVGKKAVMKKRVNRKPREIITAFLPLDEITYF